jgi:hypothetical protein
MATTIRIGRRTPATKSDDLRRDNGVWQAAEELKSLLTSKDIALLTIDDVTSFLQPRHADLQTDHAAVRYEWVFDPETGLWVLVCHDAATLSFRDQPGASPIEVNIDISATYA